MQHFLFYIFINMWNTNINVSGSTNEDLIKWNVLNSGTGDIATSLESNGKYIKLEEFDVEWHKVSFWIYKMTRGVYDVYLDWKFCWMVGSGYWISYSSLKLVWNDIYFWNRWGSHGGFYERIKDWKIDTLEDVVEVFNVNGKPLYMKRTKNDSVYRVVLWDRDFWEYKLIYDVDWKPATGRGMEFSFEVDINWKFWFVWKKVNGKKVFVTEDYVSDEFDEIDLDTNSNYLTMIWKTYTTETFRELRQNR